MNPSNCRLDLPAGTRSVSLKVGTRQPVAERQFLVTCDLRDELDSEVEILKWPIYPRTGTRSKFFRTCSDASFHRYPDLLVQDPGPHTLEVKIDKVRGRASGQWLIYLLVRMASGVEYEYVREVKS